MPVISRLIVVHSDPRIAEAVRFGFEREGARVVSLTQGGAVAPALAEARRRGASELPELVMAGAASAGAARTLLGDLRQALDEAGARAPILYLGNELDRREAVAAGAGECLSHPLFVRDVVTVGRLLATAKRREPLLVEGQLSDYGGVFYMIRAMVAMRRSGVLSLVRGLRRGELRFYEGEVTSAQVSVLHGLAALHQILLWTRAHFELRDETVVRRQQIPLAAEEILSDAERFVSEIRAVAGMLSPAAVYEPNRAVIRRRKGAIPQPVYRVLRLIDGYRTMGDVIEDSPYRVLETLHIANRLVEMDLIRCRDMPGAQGGPGGTPEGASGVSPGVSIERWLTDQYAERSPALIGSVELEPVDGRPLFVDDDEDEEDLDVLEAEAAGDAASQAETADDDWVQEWADILPTEMSSGFSPVVPATEASGEIVAPVDAGTLAPEAESARRDAGGAVSGTAPEQAAPQHELALADTAPTPEQAKDRTAVPASLPDSGAEGGRSPKIWKRIFRKPQDGD